MVFEVPELLDRKSGRTAEQMNSRTEEQQN
jgi:hypothetical protein